MTAKPPEFPGVFAIRTEFCVLRKGLQKRGRIFMQKDEKKPKFLLTSANRGGKL